MTQNPFALALPAQKIEAVRHLTERDLGSLRDFYAIQTEILIPQRSVEVVRADEMPKRAGISFREGQTRLLHDLANIELQAMELCLRTLVDYPDAPQEFQTELWDLMQSERSHFEMCLNGLMELGGQWGDFPVHLGLWAATDRDEDLLDRILVVHRYLEGNGLDAGESLKRRLTGVPRNCVHLIVETIAREEVGHVAFGNKWYRRLCEKDKRDVYSDFVTRFTRIEDQIPHRIEALDMKVRKQAGFTDEELEFLELKRQSWVKYPGLKLGSPKPALPVSPFGT